MGTRLGVAKPLPCCRIAKSHAARDRREAVIHGLDFLPPANSPPLGAVKNLTDYLMRGLRDPLRLRIAFFVHRVGQRNAALKFEFLTLNICQCGVKRPLRDKLNVRSANAALTLVWGNLPVVKTGQT